MGFELRFIKKKVLVIWVLMCVFVSLFTTNVHATNDDQFTVPSHQDTNVVSGDAVEHGDFKVTVPDNKVSNGIESYQLQLAIERSQTDNTKMQLDNPERYYVTVLDQENHQLSQEIETFTKGSENDTLSHLTIDGLVPGSTVYVSNILVEKTISKENKSFSKTVISTNLLDQDLNPVAMKSNVGNSMELVPNEVVATTLVQDFGAIGIVKQNLVETTMLQDHASNGHCLGEHSLEDYCLRCLLNSYNVVSYNDIEATHIVGPLLANGGAYRTRGNPTSTAYNGTTLQASDYSRGVSSFIKNLEKTGKDSVGLNYTYDKDIYGGSADYLYTSTSSYVYRGTKYANEKLVLNNNGSNSQMFTSPQDSGTLNNDQVTGILHNNNYVDFDKMYTDIQSDSKALLESGTLMGGSKHMIPYNSTTDGPVLRVELGKSYLVQEASNLKQINIIYPEGYNYTTDPYPGETIINFDVTKINPIDISGVKYSQFPDTVIDGVKQPVGSGIYNEYTEYGNKIIYNMPNITGRVTELEDGQSILGHMVMPQAEFWNCKNDGSWNGGDINGTTICKSFHSGNAESHMWAYDGLDEKFITKEIIATKYLDNKASSKEFTFRLTPYINGQPDEHGIIYGKSNEIGSINFQPLYYKKAGTYEYLLEEVIPQDPGGITYDESQYLVTVEVTGTSSTKLEAKVNYKLITDSKGHTVTTDEIISSMEFNNTTGAPIEEFTLPATGGPGNTNHILLGSSLMLLTSIGLLKNKYYKTNIVN